MPAIAGTISSRNGFSNKALVMSLVAMMAILPVFATGSEENMLLVDFHSSAQSNSKLGWNMTAVGDFLNDGEVDYAITAPGWNKVFIWDDVIPEPFTTAAGGTGDPDWILTGNSGSDFGWSVTGMGDYDNDGWDDLAIGAPAESKVYVFNNLRSKATFGTTDADITLVGRAGELFGHSVASLYYEGMKSRFLAVGAPKNDHNMGTGGSNITTGAVFVYNITNVNQNGPNSIAWHKFDLYGGFVIKGDVQNKYVGFTVVNIGDANGDTLDDLGFGDPYEHQADATGYNGAFYIDYGKNLFGQPPEKAAPQSDGAIYGYNNSFLGWSTASIGDIGSGPEDDVAIGAPMYGAGEAYIIYGVPRSSGGLYYEFYNGNTPDYTFSGSVAGDRYGTSIARTDIITGSDPQIFIGAPGYNNGTSADAGAVFGYYMPASGKYNDTGAKTSYVGETAGDNLGYALMGANHSESKVGRLFASAPFFGSTNTGKVYVLQRNQRPIISAPIVSPATGSLEDDFTFTIVYKDVDSDPPKYINLLLYSDSKGDNLIQTYQVPLNMEPGGTIKTGAAYKLVTKLPSSLVDQSDENERNAAIWMKAEAAAVRGSTAPQFTAVKEGPIVDGVKPSAPQNMWTEVGTEVGTFILHWEWPGEDDFGTTHIYGTVESLTIKINKGAKIDKNNWDESTTYREIRLNPKGALSNDQTVIGASDDPLTNPNNIKLDTRNRTSLAPNDYYVAMRGTDEVGNVGPITCTEDPEEPLWTRPLVLAPLDSPTLVDRPKDEGGVLKLTWISPLSTDTEYYWIYVDDQPFDTVKIEAGVYRVPDYNISRLGNPYIFYDTNNNSRGVDIEEMSGQPLENGKTYYAAVIAVNWLSQFEDEVTVSAGAKVIDDNASAIDRIKDLTAESTSTPGNLSITLHWTPTTDPTFVEYRIYAQSYYVRAVGEAVLIGMVKDRINSSFVVTEVAGDPIKPGVEYSFIIVIWDYNDHAEQKLFLGENYIYPMRVKDTVTVPMPQVMSVSLRDRTPDGGGVLELSWDQLIQPGRFWCYNVYFGEEPITDVTGMTPLKKLYNFRDYFIEITNSSDGSALVDGKGYYAAVTIVDWNDVENLEITPSNSKGPVEPVNQSDFTRPMAVSGLRADPAFTPTPKTLKVLWTPVTFEQVPDFNKYILVYWSNDDPSTPLDIEIEDRTASSVMIEELLRYTNYFINVTIVDDNGNRGPEGNRINITTGGIGVAPWNLTVTISLTIGMDQDIQNTNLTDGEEMTVSVKDVYPESDIFFTGKAEDDYSKNLIWSWNVTTPDNKYLDKDQYYWRIRIADLQPGTYTIKFKVTDTDDMSSEITVKLTIKEESTPTSKTGLILVAVLVAVIVIGVIIAFVVMRSSKSSQEKEMMRQYEERKKEIDAMEPIYVNLPSWTCSCGSTLININKSVTCPSCYESFEAVPIDGIDKYLKDHELVLAEMRIGVPLGWKGQKFAIDQAESDLVERKKRAREALDEQFAPFMKNKPSEEKPEGEAPPGPEAPTPPTPPITPGVIPGQMPPNQSAAPMAGMPQTVYHGNIPVVTQYPPK